MSKVTTHQELAAKYTRYAQVRSVISIVSGTLAIVGGVLGLRELRADRRAVTRSQP
jgi:hypothetical protein